jgi:hypothetical protein
MTIKVTNLAEVLAGFNLTEKQIDLAAMIATNQTALMVEGEAKRNANTGAHSANTPRIQGTGPGPNVVTGNLVNRIVAQRPVKGFAGYVADVSSSAEYARAVELGSPRWKSGVKYPYMEPAAKKLIQDGTLNRIFTGAFTAAIGGSI